MSAWMGRIMLVNGRSVGGSHERIRIFCNGERIGTLLCGMTRMTTETLPHGMREVLIGSCAVAFAFGVRTLHSWGRLRRPVPGPSFMLPGHPSYDQMGQSFDCKSTRPACTSWVFVQRLLSLTSCASRGTWQLVRSCFSPRERLTVERGET